MHEKTSRPFGSSGARSELSRIAKESESILPTAFDLLERLGVTEEDWLASDYLTFAGYLRSKGIGTIVDGFEDCGEGYEGKRFESSLGGGLLSMKAERAIQPFEVIDCKIYSTTLITKEEMQRLGLIERDAV